MCATAERPVGHRAGNKGSMADGGRHLPSIAATTDWGKTVASDEDDVPSRATSIRALMCALPTTH